MGGFLEVFYHEKKKAVLHFGRNVILPRREGDAPSLPSQAFDLDSEELLARTS